MNRNRKSNKGGTKKNRNDIIASRKTCTADGTGLSHYVLMDKKTK
ncbi:MAG: modified peptide precursor CbpA [Candidatus Omnitrophica bacterium]|nr:modified peptide precursor CbpA [Candidatus Omnitrophota bacterium]